MKLFLTLILPLAITWNSAVANSNSNNINILQSKNITNLLTPQTRITNGWSVAEGAVPYIVYLHFNDANGAAWYCGGSIIGHSWVLTAAHCTNGAKQVDINYGSVNRRKPLFKYTVADTNFIQHTNYPTIKGYDISLIHTTYTTFTDRVKKIQLPAANKREQNLINHLAKACGWGRNNDDRPTKTDDNLQCVYLPIISRAKCELTFHNVPYNIICTATPYGQSICSGDSGGPLVESQRLVGVSSFVHKTGCMKGKPAGFTRVSAHLEWIRDHTGIWYTS